MDYDFLSFEKIVDALRDLPEKDRIMKIAEFRKEASRHHMTRDFNAMLKIAQEALIPKPDPLEELDDMPAEITDTAGYSITEMGVFLPGSAKNFEICPYPLFPVERFADIDDGTEKLRIQFKRDGLWHSAVFPRETLATANKITQLASISTGVNSENARDVVRYLSDIESANRNTIPISKSSARLGWTENGFVPFVDGIKYAGGDGFYGLYEKFHEQGDFEEWKKLSIECLKHPVPRMVVAASYASILLKKIGVNGFCLHLWGEAGRGKTVSLMLGASVYGDASPTDGVIRNGKTTSNGIEPVLGFFNNCAVFFDELTTLTQEQITDMVYKFAQGQGKGRMNKNAGMQKTYTWNNVAILSAEKPLSSLKTESGAVARVVSVYAEGSLFGDMDMVRIANTLKRNYGFGARIFSEAISGIDPEEVYRYFLKKIPETVDGKQANAAAVLLAAYELACAYVYGIENEMTVDDVVKYLASRNDVSISERALDDFRGWVEANYMNFNNEETTQSKWGNMSYDRSVVNVFYDRFSEWCQKRGYQDTALLREWRSKGNLKTRSKDELRNTARIRGEFCTNVVSVVVGKYQIMETDKDCEGYLQMNP